MLTWLTFVGAVTQFIMLLVVIYTVQIIYVHICNVILLYRFQLRSLQQCKDNVKLIAQCFIDIWEKAEGSKIYSDYCTKYPRLVIPRILLVTHTRMHSHTHTHTHTHTQHTHTLTYCTYSTLSYNLIVEL